MNYNHKDIDEKSVEAFCNMFILRTCYAFHQRNEVLKTSYFFYNAFLNGMGIIIKEDVLLENLAENGFLILGEKHPQYNFYNKIEITDLGIDYFLKNVSKLEIPYQAIAQRRHSFLREIFKPYIEK
ncbi:hypothetical protein [Capnocytophaga canimorsus]|uniref:hypothetical protein n=1 Tax=Capnocytophaga canimorsus TaxID=28188 RepID=UPI00385E71B5